MAEETRPTAPAFEQPDFSHHGAGGPAGDHVSEDFSADGFEEVAEGNAAEGGAARAVLEHIAGHLVDDKESVLVETREQRGQLRLYLHVAPSDMGRVIGRRGRTAQALRALVRAAAASEGGDAFVEIVD